jgi:hypothetical protein
LPDIPGRLKRKGYISPAPPKDAPKEIKVYMANTYAGLRKAKFPGENKENKERAAKLTWYLTKKKYPAYFKKEHTRDPVSSRRHPKTLKPVQVKPAKTEAGRKRQVRELRGAAQVSQEVSKDRDILAHNYELQSRRIAAIERK